MLETGAHALGCTVFPGGTGQTEQQVQAIADLRPDGYVGTPSFLRDHPREGRRARRAAAVADARRWCPAKRSRRAFATRSLARGIAGYQAYATADLGTIAYETPRARGAGRRRRRAGRDRAPGHRRPGAGRRSRRSRRHALANADYPLIRFGTGDLSAVLPGAVAVRPHQPAHQGLDGPRRPDDEGQGHVRASVAGRRDRARGIREIAKARLVVDNPDGNDRMTLHVEVARRTRPRRRSDRRVDPRRHQAARRSSVPRAPATLPNDGKVIDDPRKSTSRSQASERSRRVLRSPQRPKRRRARLWSRSVPRRPC